MPAQQPNPGERIRLAKWVHGRLCVVRVEVDAVVPDADTSEPCLEPATVKWLDDLQRLADAGDVAALEKHGEVFVRKSARAPRVRILGFGDLVEMSRIVILFVFAAVVYGVAHDMVTAHACVEYFTVGHPRVIRSESPVALALVWGVIATWWAGLLAGLVVGPCARVGRWPKLDSVDVMRGMGWLLLAMGVLALASAAIAYMLAVTGVIWVHPRLAGRIEEARHARFLAVGGAHLASYAVGFLGTLVFAVLVVRRRARSR